MNNLTPQRLPQETTEQYKARRKDNKKGIKQHLKGTVVWDSSQGTYRRAKQEENKNEQTT